MGTARDLVMEGGIYLLSEKTPSSSGTGGNKVFYQDLSLTSTSTTGREADPMTFSPNPAAEGNTIFCPQLANTSGELIMIGAEGAYHTIFHQNGKVQLPSDTPPGVYTLISIAENGIYQGRLVLQ